ncbi:MAG: phosphate regulon sensor histidine kinase PhoR [Burkholderiales bacterium]|nr:phosphate regulon sensor histidine kinase PhoR [Burkholderiales bacterium]
MVLRLVSFLLCVGAGALAGWLLGDWRWQALGALIAAMGWVVFDGWRGARVLRGLRAEPPVFPAGSGLWGEVSERARRMAREREQQTAQAEARLAEFLAAIQASPSGVVLLDDQGRIEWCNQTAAQHFGFDAQRDVMQHVGNLVRDPAFGAYLASWNYSREVIMNGHGRSSGTAGGPMQRLSVQVHPYAGNRRLLLSRDITALEQAEAMRRDFVANVSHEIRTPLTVLAGFVETMQTLPLTEAERARYLGMMSQQSQRMQTLVNDLLTLSRLEGSPPPPIGQWTNVRSLLAQCEEEARGLAEALHPGDAHHIAVTGGEGLEIAGAVPELQSAMSNLLSNAVRYTPSAGRIDVAWRMLPDGRAEYSVRDTGPGIAAEHLPRLTERFYRVDRSRSRETGGTGLGLAIVKHVAQRHGGELRIESVVGSGSTFTLLFPAVRLRQAFKVPAARAAAS